MRERLSGETTSVLSGDLAYSRAMAEMRSSWPFHFMHAALPVKTFDCRSNLTVRQLLDGLLQLRVALPHDLFEPHRAHSRFLKLRERTARFDGLMLARVAYQQNAVIRMEPFTNSCIWRVEASEDSSSTYNRFSPVSGCSPRAR